MADYTGANDTKKLEITKKTYKGFEKLRKKLMGKDKGC